MAKDNDKNKNLELLENKGLYSIFHMWFVTRKGFLPWIYTLKNLPEAEALAEIEKEFGKLYMPNKEMKKFFEKKVKNFILEFIASPSPNPETSDREIEEEFQNMLTKCNIFKTVIEHNRPYFLGITDRKIINGMIEYFFNELEIISFLFPLLKLDYGQKLLKYVFLNTILGVEQKSFLDFQKVMIEKTLVFSPKGDYIAKWKRNQSKLLKDLNFHEEGVILVSWKDLADFEEEKQSDFCARKNRVLLRFIQALAFLFAEMGSLYFYCFSEENNDLSIAGFFVFSLVSFFLAKKTYLMYQDHEEKILSCKKEFSAIVSRNDEQYGELALKFFKKYIKNNQKNNIKEQEIVPEIHYPFFGSPSEPDDQKHFISNKRKNNAGRELTTEEFQKTSPAVVEQPSWFNGKLKYPHHPCLFQVEGSAPLCYAFFLSEVFELYRAKIEKERVHIAGKGRSSGIKHLVNAGKSNANIAIVEEVIKIPLDEEFKMTGTGKRLLGGKWRNVYFFVKEIDHLGKSSVLPKQDINVVITL